MNMVLATFIFFTGLVALITFVMTKNDDHGSSTGYFLGGRTLTAGFIAGSLMLTNLSTEQLVGLNGAAFRDGFSVMAWEVVAVIALVLMALFFLPRFLKSGITTVPQFLEVRFDEQTRIITTFIFVIAYAGLLLPIILYTGAKGLNGMLELQTLTGIETESGQLWFTVWLVGLIGSVYAIYGGLRTVAVSDTINGFGLLVGGIMITIFGLNLISDEGIFKALALMQEANPEKMNSIGGPSQSVPFSTLFTGVLLLNLFYWCTNQQIIQRTFGASNLAEGQKGVLMAGGLKLLGPLILVLPGLIAFHLYGDSIKADDAYGHLVRNALPKPMVGFFAAVMVGAILSSFNSALNSVSTLFSLGIYKKLVNRGASDDKVVVVSKRFGWIVALIAMSVAPLLAGQDSIFGYLQKMNGMYFIPIFSVVLLGILNRRVPAVAAKLALVLGFILIALGYFVPAFSGLVTRMHEFHFLGAVFGLLILLMLVMTSLRPRAEAWVHEHSGDVDITPWPHAHKVGAILIVCVLAIYVVFADFSVLA
ncbi:MAG: solute:sodium symporter family transporter [Myxococcales bacterium]|nr:solute:sodium symporter family transporter [Myxococcales bacterium]